MNPWGWILEEDPWWKSKIDRCSDSIIEETGYKREEIEKIFEVFDSHNVI